MATRSFSARLWRGIFYVLVAWLLVSVACVLLMRWVNPVTSAFMLRERVLSWFSDEPFELHHEWVARENISAQAKLAVIASEDQKFPEHAGFDLDSISKAFDSNRRGKRVRGASTISQQVAKNLFLWPGRSWIRKAFEAYFTVLLELLWGKERILEVYLNSAEFGRGIYGVGAASKYFFHEPASQLNASQAALLAAVLPNPKRYRVDRPTSFVRARQHWVLEQMSRLGGTSFLRSVESMRAARYTSTSPALHA